LLEEISFVWLCPTCETLNHSNHLPSDNDTESENSFAALSLDATASNSETLSISSINSDNDSDSIEEERIPNSIRILLLNCNSIKSKRKRNKLKDLVEDEHPDIIIATETKLSKAFKNSECLPEGYQLKVARKDRTENGGGVLIAAADHIAATPNETLSEDCESTWLKLEPKGSPPIHIGAFYRPTNNELPPTDNLYKTIQKLVNKSKMPNILLAGDFNVPDINWDNQEIGENPQYHSVTNLF
jgi:hypothetical protein